MSEPLLNSGVEEPARPRWRWRRRYGCLAWVVLGLIFATVAIISNIGPNDGPSLSDKLVDAKIACQDQVKSHLKSPSTAVFDTSASGTGPFTVTGSVDSENSLGATTQSGFRCTVRVTDKEETRSTLDSLG
ncbi:hypothetical protein [Curtobacterium sp. MCBD17_030]|uniref:hypothetical protein n=1 Tax=Curtobacterium sp. MCBD17_030 TaxID=2175649 RepID=UPI0011B60768|nr:hypothetical protein [Curtobacterium sp. MCBD17_030]